jgi:hypothetical protein
MKQIFQQNANGRIITGKIIKRLKENLPNFGIVCKSYLGQKQMVNENVKRF